MRHITVCDRDIRIEGRLLRIGRLEADRFEFVDDPSAMIAGLQNSGSRIDLFTFLQRLPESTPKYEYPMELDNLAVLPEARNRARQAEKKGVSFGKYLLTTNS